MRRTASAAIVLVTLSMAGAARAQDVVAPVASSGSGESAPAAPAPLAMRTIGLRAFGAFEVDLMLANVAFQDELGTSKLKAFGAGADITDLWHHVFLRLDASHLSKNGNRGFADASGVFVSENIPMTVRMTYIDIGAGWRLETKSKRTNRPNRLTPYAGGGLAVLKYSETSANSITGEDVAQSYKGTFFLAGVDVQMSRTMTVGAEGVFRSVPLPASTSTNSSSLLQTLNENNLGSAAIRITFSVKF